MNPTEDAFWLVWTPGGNAPVVKHESADIARAEAARLAVRHPGKRFFVLLAQSVSECAICAPNTKDLS